MLGLSFIKTLGELAAKGALKIGSFALENKEVLMLVIPGGAGTAVAFSGANALIDYFDGKDHMSNNQKQVEAAKGISSLIYSSTGRKISPTTLLDVVDDLVALKREHDAD